MKDNFPHLYPYSLHDAKQRGELVLWRESHRENIEMCIRDRPGGDRKGA